VCAHAAHLPTFADQGNYVEALECMERGLVLRQHFFGADSDEVWRACKTVGEMCNLLAMTYLQQEDFAMALELLKKAEILTERDPPGRAVTFNNMACYYRRMGKLHVALTNLTKALKIESRLQKVDNPADTHLNMCAVLSQLGRHQGALEHAQSSLILLQEELFGSARKQEMGADRVAVLAIAYHNIGVEQGPQFLDRGTFPSFLPFYFLRFLPSLPSCLHLLFLLSLLPIPSLPPFLP
jgi:tetratricopeptide (TPR) repeat protein